MVPRDIQLPETSLTWVTLGFFAPQQVLPLVIQATEQNCDLADWAGGHKQEINRLKNIFGALLFRGFKVESVADFERAVTRTSSAPLPYLERSSPRDKVFGHVYTSTSHRDDQEIFPHTEQSYNLRFPQNIYFCCLRPAESGGQTPLVDTRALLRRLSTELVEKFQSLGYRYQRNFIPSMYLKWQEVFQTENRREVEDYCDKNLIHYEWGKGMAELTTTQTRKVIARHPQTGEYCWFNHCTFFNVNTLDPSSREVLTSLFEEDELPNHTFFGDGSSIEDDEIQQLIRAYQSHKALFEWLRGDVLMVDNMMVAHGRQPFVGERHVVVAMSDIQDWAAVATR